MDEIAELRRQIEEERRQFEERRQIEELRRQLEERDRQLEELRRQGEEVQHQSEEERRKRLDAEKFNEPQILWRYLDACHSLHLSMKVVTSLSLTTIGETTNPTRRFFPRRIIPWDDFAAKQQEIWNDLSAGDVFHSQPSFPSRSQMDYSRSFTKPISRETSLVIFERIAVEAAVETLFKHACMDSQLQSSLGLQGGVSFEDHTNLQDDTGVEAPKTRRKSRGKGNGADEFLVYKTSEGVKAPVVAIEYKPPHKLSVNELATGLSSEIWPERDVINKDGDDFASTSRRLAAAVVTQLFSYMIGKGLQYGYVCTGQAFVFLHIPDDPSIVYFSVCVPSMDVMEDDDTRLHRTAVAQIFAFLLQAMRAEPPPEAWHDEAEKLGLWEVEYDDILAKIPLTDRKRKEPLTSPYHPQRWKGFKRSPIRTRSLSRCRQPDLGSRRPADDDEDPPSPTPNASRSVGNVAVAEKLGIVETAGEKDEQGGQTQATKPHIRSRPFCTQKCLLGLALGKPIDRSCPNAGCHGQKHINRLEFLHLIREQLAVDRGRDADCMPLHRSGSRGSLFKLRLSSHGYTLVAKGMEGLDLAHLQHENEIYDRLLAIQGRYVPVCLGSIDLILPYYYDCGVYKHFMFLGWAGRPIFECANQINNLDMVAAITRVFKAIHKLRVLHRDAELRNMLYDEHGGTLMAVDFERSAYCGRQPSNLVSGKDRRGRKKHRELQKQQILDKNREAETTKQGMAMQGIIRRPNGAKREITEADFVSELKWAVHGVSKYVSNPNDC